MNANLLRSSIDTLKSVRLELHSNVENDVIEMLDKAIFDLESLQQDPEKVSTQDVLNVLGQIMEKLPMIIELIRIVSNAIK